MGLLRWSSLLALCTALRADNQTSTLPSADQSSVLPTSTPLPTSPPPSIEPGIGDNCNITSECKTKFSICSNSTCICDSGYVTAVEMRKCLPIVKKYGEECSEDIQCREGLEATVGDTICYDFHCTCKIGETFINGTCQVPAGLETPCETSNDCPIDASVCTENKCFCRVGYVPNSANNGCLPVTLRMEVEQSPCSQDLQCNTFGDNAVCNIQTGRCICKPNNHLVNNLCVPFKVLGDECTTDEECLSPHETTEGKDSRYCAHNKCACNLGFIQEPDSDICKSIAGSLCTNYILVTAILIFSLFLKF